MTKIIACLILAIWCTPAPAQTPDGKESPYHQQLYELAHKVEQETIVKSRPLYLDMVAAHELDWQSYHFAARRWGDFLEVEVERGGKKYATALNLALTHEVKLVEGHGPDLNGTVHYRAREERDKDNADPYGGSIGHVCDSTGYCGPDFDKPPRQGYHYTAEAADLPTVRTSPRPMIPQATPAVCSSGLLCSMNNVTSSEGSIGWSGSSYVDARALISGVSTPGFARDAEDDKVEFSGLGFTLLTPASRGAEVRDEVLRAIAVGYEAKPLPGGK